MNIAKRTSLWRKKVDEKDELKTEKKDKISIACDLLHKDYVLEKILAATTIGQLERVMIDANRQER